MKNRSLSLLASAVFVMGPLPASTGAAEPPLKSLPLQQDIWISGTVQRGDGQYPADDHATLLLDRPATSPCNDRVVTDIPLGKTGGAEPGLLHFYLGQRVAVRGRVICPDSGIRFTPTPDFVFPIY